MINPLLTTFEVTMAGYWPSFFLHFYGTKQSHFNLSTNVYPMQRIKIFCVKLTTCTNIRKRYRFLPGRNYYLGVILRVTISYHVPEGNHCVDFVASPCQNYIMLQTMTKLHLNRAVVLTTQEILLCKVAKTYVWRAEYRVVKS